MSGGGGLDWQAFNPIHDWKHKSAWDKFGSLSGLPIGNAIASPKWIKAHPKEAAAAAIVAASVFTGGAAAGAWGAGAGGAAAGAEAGAGAAAGAGSGLLATDYAALGLGSAAGGGAGAGAWGGAALADGGLLAPYGGELASVGESGGTMLGGASPQELSLKGGGKSMYDTLSKISKLQSLTQGQGKQHRATQDQQSPPAQRPGEDTLAYLRRIYPRYGGQA